jgi:hypothetical protein
MSIAPTADLERAPSDPLILFAVAAACVTLADWLFFGWDIGISLAQFLGLLGVVAVTCNRVHATRGTQIIMSAAASSTRRGWWRITTSSIAGRSAAVDPISIWNI